MNKRTICRLTALGIACVLPLTGLCEGEAGYASATAIRGDLEKTVFGSGTVKSASQPTVYAQTDGKIAKILAKVGDEVKEGDVLLYLENEELDAEIERLEAELEKAQQAVRATQTYGQYEVTQQVDASGQPVVDETTGLVQTQLRSTEQSIYSPCDGRVMAVYIKPGDEALAVYREYGAVILLSTDGRMKVELDGLAGDELALGDKVSVAGEGFEAEGTVVNLVRRGTQAVIEVIGDEHPFDVDVTVRAADGQQIGTGVLQINKPLAISAYGGTIRSVDVRVGALVKRRQPLARFVWGEMPLYLTNASAVLDYAKAQTALEKAEKKRDELTVVSPCDGIVATLDAKEDDEVRDGKRLLSIVESGAGMTVILRVDELDILSVAAGQHVTMTADALPDETFTGTVLKIAPLGNTGQGVTTYNVYIAVDALDERILSGMNVSGEIAVERVADAVLIATDALQKDARGYFVTLEGGQRREVEVGMMTDELTQVVSGLSEGEAVEYESI